MQPASVRAEVERILGKYVCRACGENTARIDTEKADEDPILCWKCSAEIGMAVGEFRADVRALGHLQIQEILKSQPGRDPSELKGRQNTDSACGSDAKRFKRDPDNGCL